MNLTQADTAQPRSRMRVSWASQHLSGYWKGRDSWIEVFNMANSILCIREVLNDPRASISVPLLVVMMYINVHATVVRSYYLYSGCWHVREHPPRRRKLRMDRVDLAINVTGSTFGSVVARLPTRISGLEHPFSMFGVGVHLFDHPNGVFKLVGVGKVSLNVFYFPNFTRR